MTRSATFLLLLLTLPACGRTDPARPPRADSALPRPGVTEDAGPAPDGPSHAVYVPIYSHIFLRDDGRPFPLAVTLTVRNTDRAAPLHVSAVDHHSASGDRVRRFVPRPIRIAPLASAEFFVTEGGTTGGSSASVLVDYHAPAGASPPIVEAVMVGSGMNQGIAFTSTGRPVDPPH